MIHADYTEVLRQTGSRTWNGWWPGTVVDNADPERVGRCRVRVVQVYGSEQEDEFIADDDLPWALPNGRHYQGTGEQWVPPVGQTVWVSFIAGDHTDPIYQGGWATQDDAIPEHVSSYEPGGGPATRVVKTENGHLFEMRWKTGESRIVLQTENGVKVRLEDTPAGPYAEMCTPALRKVRLDDALQKAELSTPTQRVELLDLTQTINVVTPGIANVSTGGATNITAAGAVAVQGQGVSIISTGTAPTLQTGGGSSTSTFTGNVINNFNGAYNLTVIGVTTLVLAAVVATIASLTLTAPLVITGVLALGAAGVKFRLAHEGLFVLLQDMLWMQANHSHAALGAATTTPTTVSQVGNPPRAGGLTNVPPGNISIDVTTMLTQSVTAN